MSDLLKTKHLPIFEQLFVHLKEDTSRYMAKLALLKDCIPLMNKKVAHQFMKTIEEVLDYQASKSIFRMNTNPLSVGLLLYRVLDEVQIDHGYSEHSTSVMKETIDEKLQKVLDIYNDPDEAQVIVS